MHEFKNCSKVVALLKRSRKTIQLWVNAFNKGGLKALDPKTSPGRPSRLTKSQQEELKKDVLMNPRQLGYDFSNWEGKSASHHVRKKFDVKLGVRAAQKLLRSLGSTLPLLNMNFQKRILNSKKNS